MPQLSTIAQQFYLHSFNSIIDKLLFQEMNILNFKCEFLNVKSLWTFFIFKKIQTMKRIILLLAAVIITSTAFSQVTFGPKIGYNTAKLSLDRSDITSGLKNNFQFGVFLRLGQKIYVQPELNWLTQGSIFQTPSLSSILPFTQEVNLKTIQIPVLIGIKLIDLKLVSIRVFGGPTASIVQDKTIVNGVENLIDPITKTDISDMIWSFQVGGGIDVAGLTIDIRYNVGLINVINNVNIPIDGVDTAIPFESKTNGFTISIGYKIF